jgi:uncharacterized alpha-E superfamily protein
MLRSLADDLLLFAGITDATMRHGEGWHFIQLGRHIERAQLRQPPARPALSARCHSNT